MMEWRAALGAQAVGPEDIFLLIKVLRDIELGDRQLFEYI